MCSKNVLGKKTHFKVFSMINHRFQKNIKYIISTCISSLVVIFCIVNHVYADEDSPSIRSELCKTALLSHGATLSVFFNAVKQDDLETLASLKNMYRKLLGGHRNIPIIFYYAAVHGKSKAIHTLISEIRFNVNVRDQEGRTALHYAALNKDMRSRIDTIYTLIQFGVNIYKDKSGYKPSDYVVGDGFDYKHSQNQREKLIKMAIKINIPEIAKLFQINQSTLSSWVWNYKKENELAIKTPSSYTLEQKQEAINLILESGIKKAVKITEIPYKTLKHWFLQYKKDNQIPVRVYHSQKEKDKAIQLAYKIGIERTAEEVGISSSTISKWFIEDKRAKGLQVRKRSNYSQEEKDRMIELARENTIKTIAEKFGIHPSLLSNWIHKDNKRRGISTRTYPKYSQDYKNKIIKLALELGEEKVSKDFGISKSTLSKWIRQDRKSKNLLPRQPSYTQKQKEEAIQLALKFGVKKIAEEKQIKIKTLARWVRSYKKENQIPVQTAYPQDKKEEATELALRLGLNKASERTSIPRATLKRWVNQIYKEVRASQSQELLSYTSEQKEEAIKLVMEGEKIRIVAEELNVPFNTLVFDIRKYEYKKEQLEFLDTFEAEVLKAVEDGYTIKDIAKDFSVNRKLVAHWIQEHQGQQNEKTQ